MSGAMRGTNPSRIGPIVREMQASGPMTEVALFALMPQVETAARLRWRLNVWVRTGWLKRRTDGTYAPGPKANVEWSLTGKTGHGRAADRSAEEGSDMWLALQQLRHGQLSTRAAADVLDVSAWKAASVLRALVKFGHARKIGYETTSHCAIWEAVDQIDAS